jgi:two-component sensor histidine kinase
MKKIISILLLMMINVLIFGQDITRNITPAESNVLKNALNRKSNDSAKIDILLRLAMYNILKQGSNKPDMDSAENFIHQADQIINKSKSRSLRGYLFYVQANLSRETGNTKDGKTYAEKAVAGLLNSQDHYHLSLAYNELMQYEQFETDSDLKARIRLTELAVNAAQRSSHIELRAFLLKNLSELYSFLNERDKALSTIQLSLTNYQAIHYSQLQGVYTMFGTIYYSSGNYQKSLDYMFKALRAAENTKDTTMQLCQINNVIALIYYQLGERKTGIPYLTRAMEIARRNNDWTSVLSIMWNTVVQLERLKKYKEAQELVAGYEKLNPKPGRKDYITFIPLSYFHLYLAKGNFVKAGPYSTKLEALLEEYSLMEPTIANNIYNKLINYYLHERKLGLARKHLNTYDNLMNKLREPLMYKEFYWRSFQVDSAEGNYKRAMNDLLKFRKVNDSLFNESKNKQLKQIEVQYQTEKKEAQLKIKDQAIRIYKQTDAFQKSGLKNANLVRNISFGGVFLLLVIIGLLIRQYKHKQKSNLIMEQNNLMITHKNELLEHLLKEKEWLLKEVHHRVKNNLHTVICLLESQAAYLENDALKAIESSQHRIYAMSLIHQKLYQSEDIKTIDMSLYIPEFIQYLNDSFEMGKQIRFHLDIAPLQLGVSQAIPLALIINEAVTNSMKYAFLPGSVGIITLNLFRAGDQITLIIADNGVGIDPAIASQPTDSLGMKLMNGLSDDINAVICVENTKGTRITITFNEDPLNGKDDIIGILNQKTPQL